MSAAGIQRARAVIDRDYARRLTIEDLARCARMSKFHFIRAFKAQTGQTPHQYLTRVSDRSREASPRNDAEGGHGNLRAAAAGAAGKHMIQKMSDVTLFVNNQDEAKSFYVDKLGFSIHTDATMDNGFRWLTVTAPKQPDLEIVLMEPKAGPMFDEESAAAVRMLMKKGLLGAGAFQVDD